MLDGPKKKKSGPEVALVNLFQRREKVAASMIRDTFGRSLHNSSLSENLQSSLENKLRARWVGRGSLEYVLTWKRWVMLSGPPICALRASVRHISGKGFTGWATPTTQEKKGNSGKFKNLDLSQQAHLTFGPVSILFNAAMGKQGELNPAHSRWLQGYPPEWDDCAVTAMPSSRRLHQNLSKPGQKRVK
jgi:hypothetical protein